MGPHGAAQTAEGVLLLAAADLARGQGVAAGDDRVRDAHLVPEAHGLQLERSQIALGHEVLIVADRPALRANNIRMFTTVAHGAMR